MFLLRWFWWKSSKSQEWKRRKMYVILMPRFLTHNLFEDLLFFSYRDFSNRVSISWLTVHFFSFGHIARSDLSGNSLLVETPQFDGKKNICKVQEVGQTSDRSRAFAEVRTRHEGNGCTLVRRVRIGEDEGAPVWQLVKLCASVWMHSSKAIQLTRQQHLTSTTPVSTHSGTHFTLR